MENLFKKAEFLCFIAFITIVISITTYITAVDFNEKQIIQACINSGKDPKICVNIFQPEPKQKLVVPSDAIEHKLLARHEQCVNAAKKMVNDSKEATEIEKCNAILATN